MDPDLRNTADVLAWILQLCASNDMTPEQVVQQLPALEINGAEYPEMATGIVSLPWIASLATPLECADKEADIREYFTPERLAEDERNQRIGDISNARVWASGDRMDALRRPDVIIDVEMSRAKTTAEALRVIRKQQRRILRERNGGVGDRILREAEAQADAEIAAEAAGADLGVGIEPANS